MSVNDYDEELYLAIQNIELDEKSAAYGIAMMVVHQSYEVLTPKQKHVYDTQVVPLLLKQAERDDVNARWDPN
jgi:hypothetical protein